MWEGDALGEDTGIFCTYDDEEEGEDDDDEEEEGDEDEVGEDEHQDDDQNGENEDGSRSGCTGGGHGVPVTGILCD